MDKRRIIYNVLVVLVILGVAFIGRSAYDHARVPTGDPANEYYRGLWDACLLYDKVNGYAFDRALADCANMQTAIRQHDWYGQDSPDYPFSGR